MRTLERREFLKVIGWSLASRTLGVLPTVNISPFVETNPDTSYLFDSLITPFIKTAQERRESRTEVPVYNLELNRDRVNFLLFGWGIDYEPPVEELFDVGSGTIVSYNLKTRSMDLVSVTHDTRAPEIERFMQDGQVYKISQAYEKGGFALMRHVNESATGLAVDFQLAFKDTIIIEAIDTVVGEIEVDAPENIRTAGFYLERGGKKYPPTIFYKGKQKFNGLRALEYIKTVADKNRAEVENNVRKYQVMKALSTRFEANVMSPTLWLGALRFWSNAVNNGAIDYDFDIPSLLLGSLNDIVLNLTKYIIRRNKERAMPVINKTVYVVDPKSGDGGVQWVDINGAENTFNHNPITQKDIVEGKYPNGGRGWEVPRLASGHRFDANPYSEDLINDYWLPIRSLVQQRLTS